MSLIEKRFKEEHAEWTLIAEVDRESGFAKRVRIEKISERWNKHYTSVLTISHVEYENMLYFKITINDIIVLVPDLGEAPSFWRVDEIEKIEAINDLKIYVYDIVDFICDCISFYD